MENLRRDFERYLVETLDISAKPAPWAEENTLPFYLRNLYAFSQVSILNTPCLVMVPREETEQAPTVIAKHIRQVAKTGKREVIYASRKISAYNRKRLIEHKVPFIVPGNQMYLPPLGIDLREHFKAIQNARPQWSPSTQAAFLYALIHDQGQGFTPKELAGRLGYASMSMTRAFNELESAELGSVAREGKQRVLRLDRDKKALWEKALGFLQSPVKKGIWLKLASNQRPGVEAGLTALARHSVLAGPANPVFAMSIGDWKKFRERNDVMELPVAEPDACRIELWTYAPGLFAENGVADRFSLYLSLRGTDDERVESALEEMMEQVRW